MDTNLRLKVSKNRLVLATKFCTYAKWLYTISKADAQNIILGMNRLFGVVYPKVMRQANGVSMIAEAYKA